MFEKEYNCLWKVTGDINHSSQREFVNGYVLFQRSDATQLHQIRLCHHSYRHYSSSMEKMRKSQVHVVSLENELSFMVYEFHAVFASHGTQTCIHPCVGILSKIL